MSSAAGGRVGGRQQGAVHVDASSNSTWHPCRWANLEELEALAKPLLSPPAFDYYSSGAESESTLRDNRAALGRWRLLPRMLRDVSAVDTSCQLLGQQLASPVLVAPMAMQKLCHPEGEVAMARAAAAVGVPYILSTMATCSVDEVAAGAPDTNRWLQVRGLRFLLIYRGGEGRHSSAGGWQQVVCRRAWPRHSTPHSSATLCHFLLAAVSDICA